MRFTAGDALEFTASISDYSATEYSASYYLSLQEGTTSVIGTAIGSDFGFFISGSLTASGSEQVGTWGMSFTKGGNRVSAKEGTIGVFGDPETGEARKIVRDLQGTIATIDSIVSGKISSDQAEGSYNGRAWKTFAIQDLRRLRNELRHELHLEIHGPSSDYTTLPINIYE